MSVLSLGQSGALEAYAKNHRTQPASLLPSGKSCLSGQLHRSQQFSLQMYRKYQETGKNKSVL